MDTNPIRQIEEAIFLLRRQDMRAWSQYLLAAVPFLLSLLLFVHDMSAGYLASRCAIEALACTVAYLWASTWKAKFGATLLATMNGQQLTSPQGSFWHALYLQSIIQTLKLLLFPFAIASIVPLAWTSSFFRNATVEAGLADSSLRSVLRKSAKRAGVNGRSNWIAIGILTVIYLVTFINVYILLVLLPLLLRMFSGVETLFTRNPESLGGFNVFCVVLAITWLIIDPLVLSYAVVRCFYTEARTDGRDLLTRLRPAAVLALVLLALPFSPRLSAETISKDKLSQAIDQASKGDDYAWLRAQQHKSKEDDNNFFARLNRDIDNLFKTVGSLFSGLRDWLKGLLDKAAKNAPAESPNQPINGSVHWLLYVLAAVVLLAAIVVIWRTANKPALPSIVSSAPLPTPDITQDNVLASDLPEEEWLRMARELLAKGELRLGVRALYLSNLSYLGGEQFIHIARSKSNAIYERELRLRPGSTEVSTPFAQSNRSFERVWYGFHEVTPELVEGFQQNVEAIRRHAKA